MWFTEEEIEIAKSVDLVGVAEELGYTPKRKGRYYTLKEMDSIRIHDRRSWCRWSRQFDTNGRGGTQIDFLQEFAGMEFKEAVAWLLDYAGYQRLEEERRKVKLKHQVPKKEPEEKKPFVLPKAALNNSYLYHYLIENRCIRKEVIDYFVSQGLIYESASYHNIVFMGLDKYGVARFASMRGVFDEHGKSFKCDVEGNDKRYGFNVVNEKSEVLDVFEAAIDLMSFVDIYDDYETNKIALGMLADAPIETFLSEHPGITKIRFHLDNDEYGRKAAQVLLKKYYELGYDVEDAPPPKEVKDINEWLVQCKREKREKKTPPKIKI